MQEQSLFIAALEKENPAERAAYLDRVCADDPGLRQRIDRLLQRHHQADSFLQSPAVGPSLPGDEPVNEQAGTMIGPYKLLEQIGQGGFGVVYMALQEQPVRRKVALKVLKPGMDTRQVIARFEAERQALALMDHPHIAHVLDAGATACGRPYFVMDLIRGTPITQFCDDNQLTPRERLQLFVAVCQGVQHAHQKGIIHRDLKPSNVLVTLQDGTPVVKVIDFGIAKALGQERLTEKTLCTGFAQMIGTPLYMSPEQAELSGQDADTRTDIYSLGVLLYELLTGTTPFDKQRLREASYEELRRILREEEPAKPSTRISTLGQTAATTSANRKIEARRLSQLFRGELDWIVMKALEKDRNRRYDTASSFAADVQRYLDDEPVQACPPSAAYRLRKFARRNKVLLTTAAALAGAIVLAVAGLSVSTLLIWRQAKQTQAAKIQAEANLDTAYEVLDKVYLNLAERRLPELQALTPEDRGFLNEALTFYEKLSRQQGTELRVRRQEALAYLRVANTQALLGQHDEAQGNYTKAHGLFDVLAAESPNDPDIRQNLARCLANMAMPPATMLHSNTTPPNEQALRQAVDIQKQLVREFPTRADYQEDLGRSYANLGWFLDDERKFDEAAKILQLAIDTREKLVREHPSVPYYQEELGECLGRLATVLGQIGKFQQQIPLDRREVQLCKNALKDFPNRTGARFYLGVAYLNLGGTLMKSKKSLHEAEENLRQSVAVRAKLVDDFPGVPLYRANLGLSQLFLASLLHEQGRFAEAQPVSQEAWTTLRSLGRDHPAQAMHDWERRLRFTEGSMSATLRLLRALALVQLKEYAKATAEAKTVIDAGEADPMALYHAACVFAQAAAGTGVDATQAESYAIQAIELLRRAFTLGFTNLMQIKNDCDLDPLRQRNDFQKLLAKNGNRGATP